MADKPILQGQIKITNIGDTSITIDDGPPLEPGEENSYTMFKGVTVNGEVRTGRRSFKTQVLGDVPFGELSTGDKFEAFLAEVQEQGFSERNRTHWKGQIDSLPIIPAE